MKSLDEQIEYMRGEVEYFGGVPLHKPSKLEADSAEKDLDMCQAVLDTLLQLRGLKGNDNVE